MPKPDAPGDRRDERRSRTLLTGKLGFGDPMVTVTCCIRNFSADGAMIELESPVLLPRGPAQLLMVKEAAIYQAEILWVRDDRAGLVFTERRDLRLATDEQVGRLRDIWKEMTLR